MLAKAERIMVAVTVVFSSIHGGFDTTVLPGFGICRFMGHWRLHISDEKIMLASGRT